MLRAFIPNFRRGVATQHERALLTKHGISNPAQQDLLAWRRSALWAAVISLVIAGVLNFTTHRAQWVAGHLFSDAGHLIRTVVAVGSTLFAAIAMSIAGLAWTRLRRWRGVMLSGAAVYFASPFLTACIPSKWILATNTEVTQLDYVLVIGVSLLIPVYSLLAGLFRGARVVKEAMPETSGAGMVLLLLIPINLAAIGCFGLVSIHLTAGWGLPVACIGAIVAQLPFILRASAIVSPGERTSFDRAMRPVLWVRYLGLLLITGGFVWSIAATTVDGRPLTGMPQSNPWLPWDGLLRIAFHLLANYLVLLAAFCDLVDIAASGMRPSCNRNPA